MSSSGKRVSPTPSLYEHDLNESLDSMTLLAPQNPHDHQPPVPYASRTKSTPNLQKPSPTLSSYASTPSDTRIPRRVKSTECYNSSSKPTTGVVSQCLLNSAAWSYASSGAGDSCCQSVNLDPDVEVWLDVIPLSRRPFRNFHRDFSDGVLMAELMSHVFPKRVDLHNYVASSSTPTKKSNWETLNMKVFSKLGFRLSDQLIEGIAHSRAGYIEKALKQVHRFIENMDRKYVDTRAKELSSLASSFDGSQTGPPYVEDWCLVRCSPGEVPDCVIYQNIRYLCSHAFEEVQRANEQLRERNNELCSKVKRMETLLGLKEAHLNDLTKKIHELRMEKEQEIEGA